MAQHTHQTAPTQFVDAAGIRFAYRRFGKSGDVPLVFNMHFTGTMDHWDPAVTDGLAATREVILFNNAGISSTGGEVPTSVEEMAANAAAFIKALGLTRVDVLGFSLGGFVAQTRAGAFDYLREIFQPTLVINGNNDVILYTVNSLLLQQNLPNAQLILYPDSSHGSQYQYPALFVGDVTRFLDAKVPFPTETDHG